LFAECGGQALWTIRQRRIRHFLQHVFGVPTRRAAISINWHGENLNQNKLTVKNYKLPALASVHGSSNKHHPLILHHNSGSGMGLRFTK
jgi:hypothetical protein